MKNKILIIVPSRSAGNGRERNVDRFIQGWKNNTEGLSDLIIALDDDDDHFYPRHEGVLYDINPRIRMIPTLNLVANKYKNDYEMIAFLGDDHFIRTNWESKFLKKHNETNGYAVCYGNDLFKGQYLPTAICLSSNIIESLGYMVPENLIHMYADNFWMDLGNSLQTLFYFDNVIFEHIHPDIGKTDRDNMYLESVEWMDPDRIEYEKYKYSGRFNLDIDKLNQKRNLCQTI
jgi:hypothetical protein